MVYLDSHFVERIAVHPTDALKETHFIELTKLGDEPRFFVECSFCDEDWVWEFETCSASDYERVKFNIMNAVFECDTMHELMETLDEIFVDGFSDIYVDYKFEDDCEFECHGDCAHCECKSENEEYEEN